MKLVQKVRDEIRSHNLISRGDRVILGVSGGPDSICLLHILNILRIDIGFHLYIAHLNHNLRKTAGRDEEFVKETARKLNIPFIRKSVLLKKLRTKGSLEELARNQRLKFLIRTAQKHKADCVALAHTKDELAETVLQRILRGTGLTGLRAILPKRTIYGVTFVRPLLSCSKKEILSFLNNQKLHYQIDESNFSTEFLRNKIRLELLPYLEKNYNPQIKNVLSNLATTSALDYDYIQNLNHDKLRKQIANSNSSRIRLPLKKIQGLHPAIRHLVIRMAYEKLKGNLNLLTLIHINEFEGMLRNQPPKGVVCFPEGISAHIKENSIILSK